MCNRHSLVQDCVWHQPSREALDVLGIRWIGVRSKVVYSGVTKSLLLATVCDLLSICFLWDLINCCTG